MKKLLLFTLILILLFGFSGCSSSIEFGSIERSSSHKMSASYLMMSGTKKTKITVKEGETLEISVDIVTKKGTIDVAIFKDKDDYAYEGNDIATSEFKVNLTEPGDYTLRVSTKKHKGRYKFTW